MTATEAIRKELEHIAELQEAEQKLHGRLQTVRTGIAERVRKLQEAIEAGGTTGNELQDLVIRAHGPAAFNGELVGTYRALQERLTGKRGEFVLASSSIEEEDEITRMMQPYQAFFRLGVLEGEELIWKEKGTGFFYSAITLPVSRFIHWQGSPCLLTPEEAREAMLGGLLKLEECNIFSHLHGAGKFLSPQERIFFGSGAEGNLIIGDKAVREGLQRNAMPGFFRVAADALGKLVLEPTD